MNKVTAVFIFAAIFLFNVGIVEAAATKTVNTGSLTSSVKTTTSTTKSKTTTTKSSTSKSSKGSSESKGATNSGPSAEGKKKCLEIQKDMSDSDLKKVRETWLNWINGARAAAGLNPYVLNDYLNYSATVWSESSKAKGKIDHKRVGQKSYYDYNKVLAWFADLGLSFANVKSRTATENITYGFYGCGNANSADGCGEKIAAASKSSFDFFMREKGKAYKPHYDSIMNNAYTQVGIGIALDKAKKKYYITVHYATSVKSKRAFCGASGF